MQQMRKKQEEQRQAELEEKRRKEAEAKRLRLEEAEKKRLAMQQAIKQRDEATRRNFMVNKTTSQQSKAPDAPIAFGMKDVMKTKEQLAEDKKVAMNFRIKPLKIDGLSGAELKKMVNDLWDQVSQLESDKYDLEEEQKRQEYHVSKETIHGSLESSSIIQFKQANISLHTFNLSCINFLQLKELLERQKQINKNKALKMGLDLEELNSNIPPKVRLASKYERKVDRRPFGEKKSLFNGGYVKLYRMETDHKWEEKINQFKEVHGDKHVPKWDPSAPRKEAIEAAEKRGGYDSSDEDAVEADLVDKLRGYVDEANKERKLSQAKIEDELNSRRRSSQLSQKPIDSRKSSIQQPQHQTESRSKEASAKQQEEEEEEDDDQQEEEDEEEYEEEEEEDEEDEEYEDEEE